MWSRVIEFALACWLAMSPFIFQHSGDDARWLWTNDFAMAIIVATLALLSYWPPTHWAHLLIIPASLWLIGFGRFASAPPLSPGMQNEIVVGLLLLMFALVPNHAAHPPHVWLENTKSNR